MDAAKEAIDKAMMARCIELSRLAIAETEFPFGTVIALDGKVIAEAINRSVRDRDMTRHAEVIALSEVQRAIGREGLRRATLYTNVEPCGMCAYCIREAWIGRVVYAIRSPIMGGHSKWNILRDESISGMPQVFGPAPEVVTGVLLNEAQQAWRDWNPLAWQMIKLRGVLTEPDTQERQIHRHPVLLQFLLHVHS